MSMKKLIVIVGPTSSKKTQLALQLAKDFNLPIINTDAFQVYKELNIGTNKPDKKTIKEYDIQLIDHISIYDEWNIAVFQKQAQRIIDKYHKEKKIPILVGGSNLYVDALIKNYDLSSSSKRSHDYEDLSNEQLHTLLSKLDKQEASRIPINNRKRLIRALQIIKETNQPKSKKDSQKHSYAYDCFIIYPEMDRKHLYDQINQNVKAMINSGWKDEVIKLLSKDPNVFKLNAFKAIGYGDVYQAIINKKEINIDEIAKRTRHYAKRQVTWCLNQYKNLFKYQKDVNNTHLQQEIKKFLHD